MVRPTVPRVMVMLTGALLLMCGSAAAPATTPNGGGGVPSDRLVTAEPSTVVTAGARTMATAAPATPPPTAPELFPPAGKTFIGVMTDKGPYDFTAVDKFTTAAKRQPQVMLFGSGWATGKFDRAIFDRISERGMLPMLGWEPWDYRLDEAARKKRIAARKIDRIRSNQPAYRLAHITRGDFDSYLRSWAVGIRSLGYPVAIRFAHEMNGDWYPWCELVNGNRPGDYVRAWRHVHDVFRKAGATNVIWVWSANVRWSHSTPKLSTYYPGDAYVDWLGVSGYYGTGVYTSYRSFDAIFKKTITEIRTFSRKPMVITETGASDATRRKAEWVRETFRILPGYKDIIGLIWFEVNKELDWRIVSSAATSKAFAQAVAAPRYDFRWSPDMVPRTEVGGR
ncbi:glycoside hydrolase family 26 protein [Micromonospora sp. NPDC005806]|uniref:glycoside hydrolase family 26 protein n=1 Tax=Micromonospora sp. NPDC005806 TaxID=3364234 RepID=UPI00367BA34E